MATVEDDDSTTETPARDSETALPTRFGVDRIVLVVAGLTAFALFARFLFLGERIAHWDEGRVGWWILQYLHTGDYAYRAIIHGPFYHHVNSFVFSVFGASDFAMRAIVALLGGLTPLLALGLRHRLRDLEVGALALFLAVNPLLLYYTRFMRGDPLVAVFMLAALVAFVRLLDFRRPRYLFLGVAATALAFTAKENALIYPITWAGAAVLLLDHRLFLAREGERAWTSILMDYLVAFVYGVWDWLHWILLAVVEFFAIIVFFYAPRDGDPTDVGLYNALSQADLGMFVTVVDRATVGAWKEFFGLWVSGDMSDHAYIPYLGDLVQTLGYGALALCVLAVVGFVVDRYSGDRPRDLVSFAFYCGFVSVLGYPIVTDIQAPWAAIHAVVPLAIPAAVGFALLLRWGRESLADDDPVGMAAAAVLVIVVVSFVAGAGVYGVYLAPQAQESENALVQYAQPGDDVRPALDRMDAAAAANDGTDVLLYGDFFVDGGTNATTDFVRNGYPADSDLLPSEQRGLTLAPACADWFNALPLPWYFNQSGASVDCAQDEAELGDVEDSEPPVVIVAAHDEDDEDDTVNEEAQARRAFPDYWSATYELRTYGTETVFLIHPDYVGDANATATPPGT
ncbi:flippase activity-associated protein Agl23 [Halorientalis halophila]|uniref:flippase activity-associated protein Agl23 n=1 Tax=Halorientalis halophila TaxID=3108499 RepID=UPI0030092B6D